MSNLRPLILMVPPDVRQIDVQCLVKDGTVKKNTYMMNDIKNVLLNPKEKKDGEK